MSPLSLIVADRRKQAKQVHSFREDARTEGVEFTARDKETLVSE
jgi:hypothetical protein